MRKHASYLSQSVFNSAQRELRPPGSRHLEPTLAVLPVEALRIPDKTASRLQSFDLRTIGQVQVLPRESLPSRFGKLLLQRLDQMFGHCDEMFDPVPSAEPVSAEWHLVWFTLLH